MSVSTPSQREISAQLARPREYVSIRGIVSGDPVSEPGRVPGEVSWRFPLRVTGMNRLGNYQKASGTVDVRWWRVPENMVLEYGQYREMSGVITDRKHAESYRLNLPPYDFRVDSDKSRLVSSGRGSNFAAFCYRMRHRSWNLLGRGLEEFPDHAGIVRALLLGYRHELPYDHNRLFASTGTLHIFAISGLHVGVVALLFITVLKSCGLSRHQWVYYLAPFLVMYTVATGMRASAMRACVMALVYWSAFLFRRRPDSPSAFACAALLIVAAVPTQLVAPGFIYSFVIVAGLLRLYPVISGPAASLFINNDPWSIELPKGWIRYLHGTRLWVLGLMGTSTAAWLSSAPLTAHYFNLLSPIALLGNLVVIPGAFLIVLTACLSLIAGSVWSIMAEVFNHANRMFLIVLIYFIEGMSQVPNGHRNISSPHWVWMLLWYGIIFGGLIIRTARFRAGFLLAVLCIVTAGVWNHAASRTTALDVMDVRDGHATLIRVPGNMTVLYDTGPRHGNWRLMRYLRRQGVNRLDILILSTPTAPYLGGVIDILDKIPVGEVWMPPQESRSTVYRDVINEIERRSIPVRRLEAGTVGQWKDVEWEVLHPTDSLSVRRSADAALVMRVAHGGGSVLLMGGGGNTAEARILQSDIEPASGVIIYGNQGAEGTASLDWLNAVGPRDVILVAGGGSRGKYPDDSVLDRLRDYGSKKWRTDRDGIIRVEVHSSELSGSPGIYHRILVNDLPTH